MKPNGKKWTLTATEKPIFVSQSGVEHHGSEHNCTVLHWHATTARCFVLVVEAQMHAKQSNNSIWGCPKTHQGKHSCPQFLKPKEFAQRLKTNAQCQQLNLDLQRPLWSMDAEEKQHAFHLSLMMLFCPMTVFGTGKQISCKKGLTGK